MKNPVITSVMAMIHFVSGYYVAVVIFGGVPTWPQGARVLLAILTNLILAYEFVYLPAKSIEDVDSTRRLLRVSIIPFLLGAACVLILFLLWR